MLHTYFRIPDIEQADRVWVVYGSYDLELMVRHGPSCGLQVTVRGLGGRTYLDKAMFGRTFQHFSSCFHVFPADFTWFHLVFADFPGSEVKGGKEAQLGSDVELPAFTDRVYIGGKVRT